MQWQLIIWTSFRRNIQCTNNDMIAFKMSCSCRLLTYPRAISHRLLLVLLQTAGFVYPSSVAPRSATIHRAVTTTTTSSGGSPWNAASTRKNACLQRQQPRRSAGARDRSHIVLGARRRDDFFDDDDDLYDDLDDGRSMAPQRRRPKVPLLPPTLSKVSTQTVRRRCRGSLDRVGSTKRRRLTTTECVGCVL